MEFAMNGIFDSLGYARRLKDAGFTPEQAEALADSQVAMLNSQLASKQDMKDLENRLTTNMKDLENRLTIRMGALGAFVTATTVALIKLI